MHTTNETLYLIAMNFIPGIGPRTARKLISLVGSASQFFDVAEDLKISGVRNSDLKKMNISSFLRKAEDEITFHTRNGIRAISFLDEDFPYRLKSCDDAPLVMFSRGEMDLNASRTVAVVGSRNATEYGNRLCDELIEEMGRLKCTLISGLAYGIDSFAHRAAEREQIQNIAVLAHGLETIYPAANYKLARSMEKFGGVVSDFPTGTKPDRENFPKRNRIIAGLADVVIVVEAKKKGGALITAELALGYNRDVFAIPGRIGDEMSSGCNTLIKNNKAAILSSAQDLGWYMSWKKKIVNTQTSLFKAISEDEKRLISLLQSGRIHLDELSIEAELPLSKINSILLELEFKGFIKSLPGKNYQLIG